MTVNMQSICARLHSQPGLKRLLLMEGEPTYKEMEWEWREEGKGMILTQQLNSTKICSGKSYKVGGANWQIRESGGCEYPASSSGRIPGLTIPFIHSFIYLFIHSFIHLFIYSFIHSFIHSCLHPFIHLFIYSFIYSLTFSLIHSFIHSFIRCRKQCTLR